MKAFKLATITNRKDTLEKYLSSSPIVFIAACITWQTNNTVFLKF